MSSTTESRRRAREDDDEASHAPPYSRPRLDTEDETLVNEDMANVGRHPIFYRDDGDCILRIYRHLLNHEPSAFYGLFSLPGGAEGTIEGKNEALTITLVGYAYSSCVIDFRDCALSNPLVISSPLDLQYGRIPPGDISNLMKTVKFTHKYRLDSFEKWAVKAIINVCAKGSWALLQACLPEVYVALLELDLLCLMPPVKAAVRTQWVARIRNDDPAVTPTYALDTADKFHFRALQGDVYYIQLQALVDPLSATANVDAGCTLPDELSDLHKLRILMGFRSVALAWDRISAICPHGPDFHLNSWEEEWRHTVDDISAGSQGAAFLSRFQTLQSSLALAFPSPTCPAIAEAINRRLGARVKTLRSSMQIISSDPSPWKTRTNECISTRTRLENLVQFTTLAASAAKDISDAAKVPFLGSTATLSLAIVQAVQTVKSNRDICIKLVERIHEIICKIIQLSSESKANGPLAPTIVYNIAKFAETLQKMYTVVKSQQGMRSINKIFKQGENASKLAQCQAELQDALSLFRWQSSAAAAFQMNRDAEQNNEELMILLAAHPAFTDSDCASSVTGTLESMGSSSESLSMLPPMPAIFHGRGSELEKIVEQLRRDSARIAILGMGGMGKTSLAAAVLQDPAVVAKYPCRYFVPCHSTVTCTDLAASIASHVGLDKGPNIVANLVRHLKSGPAALLVLDTLKLHGSRLTRALRSRCSSRT
ncbi:hypothetical protein DFH09DRAFT_1376034 [Mycena vulgaris]|nr:hypothetical protein DFH09DRAFT_1376034 [Mycena vulgaris]